VLDSLLGGRRSDQVLAEGILGAQLDDLAPPGPNGGQRLGHLVVLDRGRKQIPIGPRPIVGAPEALNPAVIGAHAEALAQLRERGVRSSGTAEPGTDDVHGQSVGPADCRAAKRGRARGSQVRDSRG
jgi:hypothetical protein